MNKSFRLSIVFASFVLLTCCWNSVVAQSDLRISEIRRHDQTIRERITLAEQNPESSSTFLNELVVNKNDAPYPAVGIYHTVARFYYTFGDRERNPYPERLLKIVITTERSDRKESSEYLFNDAGQLILFSEKTGDFDSRIYFARERSIGFEKDGHFVKLKSSEVGVIFAQVIKQKAHLVTVFRGSLQL